MQPVLARAQIRRYDELAIGKAHVPGMVLMENAGRGAWDFLRTLFGTESLAQKRITIVAGSGNNGGDGFVLARYLLTTGHPPSSLRVMVFAEKEKLRGDARQNWQILTSQVPELFSYHSALDSTVEEMVVGCDIVIDALFGTGLTRPITGELAKLIALINNAQGVRVALDIPSGLDADTGCELGIAVRAHATATFAYFKPGLLTPRGREFAGKIAVIPLYVPDRQILPECGVAAHYLEKSDIAALLKPRRISDYKHRAGDVLIVAGSLGKSGAALLSAHAALRGGAGLATIATWKEVIPQLAVREVMLSAIERNAIAESLKTACRKRSAILIGPGLGTDSDAATALNWLLENTNCPLVLDADALTLLAQQQGLVEFLSPRVVLTPHSGELARLLGKDSSAIENDRYAAVQETAKKFHAVVVLKGAHTLISSDGNIRVSPWCNPVLATAGAGDVLAGLLAAFLCQLPAWDAATAAVFVHGLAAEIWSRERHCDRGLLAHELADLVPQALAEVMGASQRWAR
ncbi:MAG: NAD(P)H-hydrate dehydratase [Leptospiraceae bacterium]|nr:NAD(P)H-hydrate dehydratase [Leptospiraceae bacterium]